MMLCGSMFLVGLTGGIASGKSTVSSQLREFGCPVIDADAVARKGDRVEETNSHQLHFPYFFFCFFLPGLPSSYLHIFPSALLFFS